MTRKKTISEFIEQANKVHENKYGYDKVDYKNDRTKITIICYACNNEFPQTPNAHLRGDGCPKCGIMKRAKSRTKTQEEIIQLFIETHGEERYNYSLVIYKLAKEPVKIICNVCKLCFDQTPYDHYANKQGCRDCGKKQAQEKMRKPLNQFITDVRKIHGDKYNYDKVDYQNNKEKIIIGCSKHGEFKQIPSRHLAGDGCPKCGKESMANKERKTLERFIFEAKEIHGDKYDYSKTEYDTCMKPVIIICNTCGYEFKQTPNDHLCKNKPCGCPKCGIERRTKLNTMTQKEFLSRAKEVHGYRYDYSQSKYINGNTNITIICKLHGPFEQQAASHLAHHGCRKCNKSKGELAIEKQLKKMNLDFEEQKCFPDCKHKASLYFDFFIPSLKLLIEYDGEQHFYPNNYFYHIKDKSNKEDQFNDRIEKDKIKVKYACKMDYYFLRISYLEYENIPEIITDVIDVLDDLNFKPILMYDSVMKNNEHINRIYKAQDVY